MAKGKVRTHDGVPQDSVSGVETHGIDHIPENERYGSPRQLLGLWAAPQVNYLVLVMGGTLVSMGLSFVQAVCVILVGNLFAILTGIISASGPASGTPSQIIQRALFGTRGNLVNQVFTGWIVNVMFLALNWTSAAVIIFEVLKSYGLKLDNIAQGVVITLLAAITLIISVYGYNFITKVYGIMTWVFIGVFGVAAVFLLTAVHQSPGRAPGLSGFDFWVVAFAGVSMLGCTPISYTNAADFARYLPKHTSVKRIVAAVSTGYMVPSSLISILGAYVTAALGAANPQDAIQALLPVWFAPIFAVAVVCGTIANNAMTAYSSGLVLQTIGVKLRRSITVIADGIFGVFITILGVLVLNFVDAINTLLQLIVIIVAPLMSVYLADMWLRRNHYDGRDLELGHPNGKYWYSGGYNIAGIVAFGIGLAACLLTVYTDFYVGPINTLLGGLDISFEVGLLLPGLIYIASKNGRLTPQTARAE